MITQQQIEKLVSESVVRLNEQLPAEMRLSSAPETVITGDGAQLESLSLVLLLVDIEENASAAWKKNLSILDEGVSSEAGPQFRTLAELVQWIQKRLGSQE